MFPVLPAVEKKDVKGLSTEVNEYVDSMTDPLGSGLGCGLNLGGVAANPTKAIDSVASQATQGMG